MEIHLELSISKTNIKQYLEIPIYDLDRFLTGEYLGDARDRLGGEALLLRDLDLPPPPL